MSTSFKEIKTISFDMLDISAIKKEEKAKEVFLTTFSRKPYKNEEFSLYELMKDGFLDEYVNSLENMLSEMEGKDKPHLDNSPFEEPLKKLVFKSFLQNDFEELKTSTTSSEDTLNHY